MTSRFISIVIIVLFILSISIGGCATNQDGQKQSNLSCDMENAPPSDKYRFEVAYEVNENWVFVRGKNPDQSLLTSITFKIMPNGEIKDIKFIKRSGNKVLDQSALNAIIETNPTKPFPTNIEKPFLIMGIRFSPSGVK